jgi:4,5-DOPA dioxygenase extradiol
MNRKSFLKLSALLAATGCASQQEKTTTAPILMETETVDPLAGTMPVLFLGHGSPMNAIEENAFVQGFRTIGAKLPRPKAILCVSAHWETRGTRVTAMTAPRTIHDFGGFPKALFDVQYPAPGSPWLAEETKATVQQTTIEMDHQWGLDHGAWSVVKHLYPQADVPIIQMSLDVNLTPSEHFALAKELADLRQKGVLIVGSGNMVHNLGKVAWDQLNTEDYAYDWARVASDKMKQWVLSGDHSSLCNYAKMGAELQMAIPTPEHFLPLLYTLGVKNDKDQISLFNDKAVAGALTMTSVFIHST